MGKDAKELRRTSLIAPAEDLDRLREIAEAEHRTLSQELRHLIAERIKDADVEAVAA